MSNNTDRFDAFLFISLLNNYGHKNNNEPVIGLLGKVNVMRKLAYVF
jgi:hypothetical protein